MDIVRVDALWGERALDGDFALFWVIGTLRIWCKCMDGELWIMHQKWPEEHRENEGAQADPPVPPDGGVGWGRWALPAGKREICFSPLFPDRPVVVRPETPFHLLDGSEARIFVRVPVWVGIGLSGGVPAAVTEIPTVILSDTWFGTPTEGVVAYAIRTSARRTYDPDPGRLHTAVCPLQLVNRSGEDLAVEKLCIRVGSLTMFREGDQLWADEARVTYRGASSATQIEIDGKAPPEAPQAKKISEPREPERRGFAAKTFQSLRELSHLGNI